MEMNSVVHFEMPAEDRKRMADFYTKVFGWKTQQLGEDMGNYVLATTTDSDEKGPKKPGAINGGFFQQTDDKPAQYPSVVIQSMIARNTSKRWRRQEVKYSVNLGIFLESDCMYRF
jgi:predicted enzyme related to lactoylglutathione lyase